jgi:hypothetical protein
MIRDDDIVGMLERLNHSTLSCADETVECLRDFGPNEVRLRGNQEASPVRINETSLIRLIQLDGDRITEERLLRILCDIYHRPELYPRVTL